MVFIAAESGSAAVLYPEHPPSPPFCEHIANNLRLHFTAPDAGMIV